MAPKKNLVTTRKSRKRKSFGSTKRTSAYHAYMSTEPAAIKKKIPDIKHRDAFTLAAKSWRFSPQNPKNYLEKISKPGGQKNHPEKTPMDSIPVGDSEDTPDDMPVDNSDDMPVDNSDDMPVDNSDDMSEDGSDDDGSDDMPEDGSDDDGSDDMPVDNSEDMEGDMPEDNSKDMERDMPEDSSEDTMLEDVAVNTEDIPENAQEDMLVTENMQVDSTKDVPEDIPENNLEKQLKSLMKKMKGAESETLNDITKENLLKIITENVNNNNLTAVNFDQLEQNIDIQLWIFTPKHIKELQSSS